MIGRYETVIDGATFAKGMSSSPDLADGGFSPETEAVNLIGSIGDMYPPASAVDKSGSLGGNLIAWCPTNVTSTNGFMLGTDGKIAAIDSSQALTFSSALAGTFTTGTSDIDNFIDKIYATSNTDVCRMDTNLTNGNAVWWSSTLGMGVLTSGVRHPLQKFQDRLWVGDNNALHNIVDSATGNKNVLLLTSQNEITALGVDPSSGLLLIGASQGPNYSGTIASGNKIFTYDGFSSTYRREYEVDGVVTGFHAHEGIVFVTYGLNFGYWNGAGVTFLRKLKNATLAGADLAYKHHMTHIGNTIYVIDGTQILAYGEVQRGKKVFYYAQKNAVNSNNYGLVCPVSGTKLGLGFASNKFYTFDTMDITSGADGVSFYSNRINSGRPIYVRTMALEYPTAVANNDDNRTLYYRTNNVGFGTALSSLKNLSGGSVNETRGIKGALDNKPLWYQLRYNHGTVMTGVRRLITYYDPAE